MYSWTGRPSIPPEKLLRTLLLQILYTIRSERLLMEQLDYNLLFRWFVGLNMDDAVWDATVFSKNRDRLLEGDAAEAFFDQVLAEAQGRDLLSDEHFTVDGTLVEAWASQKSFQHELFLSLGVLAVSVGFHTGLHVLLPGRVIGHGKGGQTQDSQQQPASFGSRHLGLLRQTAGQPILPIGE